MRDRLLAAATVCVIVAIAILGALSPRILATDGLPYKSGGEDKRPPHQAASKQRYENTGGKTAATAPPKFLGTLNADPNKCYEDEKEGECASRGIQEGIAGFYPYIAGGTILQVFVAGGTLWMIRRQLKVNRAQMRAYVSVVPAGLGGFAPGKVPKIEMEMKNHGITPAHNARFDGSLDVICAGPVDIDRRLLDLNKLSASVLFPGASVKSASERKTPLTEREYRALLESDDVRLTAIGIARYTDAFDRKQETTVVVWVNRQSLIDADEIAKGSRAGPATIHFGYDAKNCQAT